MSDRVEIDTGTDELLCHIEERVGVITLNKPKKKNALGDILTPALRKAVLTLDEREDVGCVMITGAGDHHTTGQTYHCGQGPPAKPEVVEQNHQMRRLAPEAAVDRPQHDCSNTSH